MTVHDRSSAHFAAWHSVKRSDDDAGDHFGLVDSRVWLRLHFWACRTVGAFKSSSADISSFDNDGGIEILQLSDEVQARFQDWYTRFLGHFVRIYERDAPSFALESAEWSDHLANLQAYVESGNKMSDVLGANNVAAALRGMTQEVRDSISSLDQAGWPYRYKNGYFDS